MTPVDLTSFSWGDNPNASRHRHNNQKFSGFAVLSNSYLEIRVLRAYRKFVTYNLGTQKGMRRRI